MSNPISLYKGELPAIIAKIRSYDDDSETDEDYEFPYEDLLEDQDATDDPLMDLGNFVEKNRRQLNPAEALFLRSFIWDWIDEEPVIDLDVDRDELGVNAVIANSTLKSMNLQTIDTQKLSAKLFSPGAAWETAEKLTAYLNLWLKAFTAARDSGQGIVLKVWV